MSKKVIIGIVIGIIVIAALAYFFWPKKAAASTTTGNTGGPDTDPSTNDVIGDAKTIDRPAEGMAVCLDLGASMLQLSLGDTVQLANFTKSIRPHPTAVALLNAIQANRAERDRTPHTNPGKETLLDMELQNLIAQLAAEGWAPSENYTRLVSNTPTTAPNQPVMVKRLTDALSVNINTNWTVSKIVMMTNGFQLDYIVINAVWPSGFVDASGTSMSR